MEEYNQNAFSNWNENVLEACPHCERTFVARALEIHLKSCKAGKLLKPKLGAPKPDPRDIRRAPVQIHEFKPLGQDAKIGASFGDAGGYFGMPPKKVPKPTGATRYKAKSFINPPK